jgi:hypothetical protein
MVACLVYIRTTAKVSIGRKAALGLRHIGLFEAPSLSCAKNRAGSVMSLSGQRLTFCKRCRQFRAMKMQKSENKEAAAGRIKDTIFGGA